MTITVRLEPDIAQKLDELVTATGLSRSKVVKNCILKASEQQQIDRAKLALELGKDMFGKYGSGRSDISENTESVLGEIFAEKKRERDAQRRHR